MNRTAYLLAWLAPGKLPQYSFFSDSQPTKSGDGVWATVWEGQGRDYEDAMRNVMTHVRAAWPWLEPLIHRRPGAPTHVSDEQLRLLKQQRGGFRGGPPQPRSSP